jgi:hypothetical protein
MRTRTAVNIMFAMVILGCGVALLLAACAGPPVVPPPSVSPTPTATATPNRTPVTKPTTVKAKPPRTTPPPPGTGQIPEGTSGRPTILGDDVVHAGEDVPAATYRAVKPVDPDGYCYWQKSSDAEGQHIISNGNPTGGRPAVTLKAGQWFTSQGCPDWLRQ